MAKREIIRNKSGKPFSGWKPSEKFEFVMRRGFPLMAKDCVKEYQFWEHRAWRLDYAWPAVNVAVEIQGFGPGHSNISDLSDDNIKANEALLLGWKVFRFDSRQFGKASRVDECVADVWEMICALTTK